MAAPALDPKVRPHARLVDEAIGRFLPAAGPMREPLRHVTTGGKRVRATLCLLVHEAAGGRTEDALPAAVGIELLHAFTLVHDDIMDKATLRRGRPTVGAAWGDDVAITVGDALFALAFEAISSCADAPGMDERRVLDVLRRASRASVDVAHGQTLDLLLAKRSDVTPEDYLEMIRLKTGVLLELSLAAGAVLGGAPERTVRALSRFGAPLGVAFQIRDDLLDLVGDPRRTGKPLGGDVRTGKRTLMVAHAFAHSPRAARLAQILDAPPERTTDDDVREAIRILDEAGSLDHARDEASRRLAEAQRALADVDLPRLAALSEVADFVLRRDA